ncbi:hypothetical protein BDV27DRAFT_156101 [Aspergillus caelatus]|uniref:Uncharacterized protein n=2 Tax=Aspergillus subgen. Circumdati TaxID=2720871 RepID=A0A5N7A8T1_9EURO|nr:uncharacterized protein BDV27DRAFT_156101 [Aspergillus caelatus]KAE8366242.1 hypothetical protein BDV27DRAFT_156101 [Aspergillus caelatus]
MTMGWFSDDSDQAVAYDEYNNLEEHHEASLTHELLGGAIAFEAAKAYEDHCAKNGEPDSHAMAKEILAAITGAILDREIETRGLDWIDRERAQAEADNHLDGELQNRYN